MSSTTVIVLALMLCAGVAIGAWVYIQTHQEEQAYKKNSEALNRLRGEISRLTREKNELNTRLYGVSEVQTMNARTVVELKAAIDWLKAEVHKPQKMLVEIPAGIELKTTRKVTKKKAKKKTRRKAPVRKKKAVKKKAKKAASRTVKKIQRQLTHLSH